MNLRRFVWVGAAFVALLPASVAYGKDSPSLQALKDFCVTRSAAAPLIEMDLAAAGWRELAQDVIATQPAFEMAKGFSMHWRSVRAWALPDASPQLLIMLGSGAPNAGAITDSCLIAGGPAFSGQLRAVRDWLGFGPAASWGPGGENFAIRRDSTGALTNPMTASVADQEKFQQAGEIAFIQVVGDGRASVLNYSAVRANPAP